MTDKQEIAAADSEPEAQAPAEHESSLLGSIGDLTGTVLKLAVQGTGIAVRRLTGSQEQMSAAIAAGRSLKDLREVAGLTLSELSDAIKLKDKSLLAAVENGTATLSFELILRLSAVLARNDPIPFILKYSRSYNPELWQLLHNWGLGRLPLQYERERQFINILRSHDDARQLSDVEYERVLRFTRQAFEMALEFSRDKADRTESCVSDASDSDESDTANHHKSKPELNK